MNTFATQALVRWYRAHDVKPPWTWRPSPKWYRAMAIRLYIAAHHYEAEGALGLAGECRRYAGVCRFRGL